MRVRLAKMTTTVALLAGLCAPVLANTTAGAPVLLAQTDLAIPPVTPEMLAQPAPALELQPPPPVAAPAPAPTRIALLLPLRSPSLGIAAQAVRGGFMVAHEREKEGIAVEVIETGDAPEELLFDYQRAAESHDIVVGPLSRSGTAALAQSTQVNKPTLALTQADTQDGTPLKLPPKLLAMGLSLEAEARQAAKWAKASKPAGSALALSTDAAWQRRAANAFVNQWQQGGLEAKVTELVAFSGYLGAKSLTDLAAQIEAENPALLFAALDAEQAKQLRAAVGNRIPIYGTSQLNPFALLDPAAGTNPELNGTRLIDIPWQLQAQHPAVMAYPRPALDNDQKRSADLERLYALGIDAYRVAREIAFKRTDFELDGVTGKLKVRLGPDAAYFERIEPHAVYRDGSVVAVGTH